MGINWVDQCDLMICHKKTGQLRQKSLSYQSSQSVLPHVEELSSYFMIQVELDAPNPTDWVVFHYVCENCALFLSLRNTSEERFLALLLAMITSSCPGFTFTFHEQQSCVGLFSVILRSNSEKPWLFSACVISPWNYLPCGALAFATNTALFGISEND